MALAPRLDLRQSQQLVMTPQLQQAIKLLQLTNLELTEFVAGEIEQNPLLEEGERDGDQDAQERTDYDESGSNGGEGEGEVADSDAGFETDESIMAADSGLDGGSDSTDSVDAPLDADYEENVFNNNAASDREAQEKIPDSALGGEQLGYTGAGAIQGGGGFADDRSLEERMSAAASLKDFIDDQLRVVPMDAQDRIIASYLIELADDAGYITGGLDDAHEVLGCEEVDILRVLELLQGLEPTGIFARNLAECLALQLKDINRFDPCMKALLDNLELLGKRDFPALRRICGVDNEDLIDMIREIQALNPKPGLAVSGGEPAQTVIPDVFVRKNPAGAWTVELNSDTLPRVLVNTTYYAELAGMVGSKEDKAYISECFSTANWLVKALDQRARTILKVASEIVRQQEGFFEHGVRHLRPMNLKVIAEAIEMHESTVSRVTSNKYLATSRGIFELKYFFNSAIAGSGEGESHSAEAVRDRIRELIENENPKAILSDDKIVDILRDSEIDIARRTVAKYREAMGIPSSVQRRREKKMLTG